MRLEGVMATVMVDNIDRAMRFYRDILGLTVQMEQEDWAIFEEGVALAVSPEPIPEINRNINAVMLTLAVADAQEAYKALTSQGVAFFTAPIETEGAWIASFRDTENNLIQLIQFVRGG